MTSSIRTTTRSAIATAILAVTLACSGKSSSAPLADDLLGDLASAQSSAIELANESARRTQVVSALELRTAPGAGPDRAIATVTAPRLTVRNAKVGNKPTLAPVKSSNPTVFAPKPASPTAIASDTLRPTGGHSAVTERQPNTASRPEAPVLAGDTLGPIGPRPSPSGAGPT